MYPCECVTRRVLTETCALCALWKPGFTTGEPRFTLATSHLEKSIVLVSLALRYYCRREESGEGALL